MRGRLKKILGKDRVGEVNMGTFHSLCARFLRKYAHTIGLSGNFSICDADESKRIIGQLLKKYTKFLSSKNMTVRGEMVMSKISRAKAKSVTADQFAAEVETMLQERGAQSLEDMSPMHILGKITAEIYQEYEKLLRRNNSLDFDDLLVFGVKMFKKHKDAITWCQHVLVDEFQDTNTIQYDLMRTIAFRQHVTIVGDPDQSIYGWRSAEVENLNKMKKDFPGTQEVFLEENYRSTGAILRASLAIIAEDKNRIQKSLHTTHPVGKTPTLRPSPTEFDEASSIAIEIKRVMAYMGGALQFGDFAVLLRFNALSRVIESALQKEAIPCRILGGHRFFERLEVKDLLAYLQLVDNSDFYPAFARAVNIPSRGVGEKTLLEVASKAEFSRVSHLEILERIHDGKIPDIKPPVKRKITSFISTIRILRDLDQKGISPAEIIRRLLQLIDYTDHLRKTQTDWENRWANVEELINFATEIGFDTQTATSDHSGSRETPLRSFLQASSLSSEGDNDSNNNIGSKVTIATCHAAKGLEWPVVMIPSVEDGIFPLSRSDDVEEERRLLYVACTRAQGLLYLTYAQRRKIAGRSKDVDRSNFIQQVLNKYPDIFTNQYPELDTDDRLVLSSILHREIPDEVDVARKIAEFNEAIWDRASHATNSEPPGITEDRVPPPAFSSGSTVLRSGTLNSQRASPMELPMPSFQTSTRMLLFHSLQRINDGAGKSQPESNPQRTPAAVSAAVASGPSSRQRAPEIEPPMPSFQTVTSSRSHNQISVASPMVTRADPHWSRPGNTFHQVSEHRMDESNRHSPSNSFRSTESSTSGARMKAGSGAQTPALDPISCPPLSSDPNNILALQCNPSSSQQEAQWSKKLATPHDTEVSRSNDTWEGAKQDSQSQSRDRFTLALETPENETSSTQLLAENDKKGVKRRLGMGRGSGGYANKKFKPPLLGTNPMLLNDV
ncbi:hypothetical protein AX15_004594 [Amanita polypyramis BW_CC]|nr:hypothetical protein AX15_004594 [Amanita polypyramis BW_CC]